MYKKFKEQKQKELNELPIMFAFSNKSFEEMKNKLGITNNNELYLIGNGGFIRKSDVHLLEEMMIRHDKEYEKLVQNDEFLYDAFYYELSNHEYCVTLDPTDALKALDFTVEEIEKDQRLIKIYSQAKKDYLENCIY